jgi:hypothetical protein
MPASRRSNRHTLPKSGLVLFIHLINTIDRASGGQALRTLKRTGFRPWCQVWQCLTECKTLNTAALVFAQRFHQFALYLQI